MGCLNLSLDAKHYMWAYLISYSVKWKYWNDFVSKVFGFVFGKMKVLECLCRENEILAYMVRILINMKDELVPWFKTWYLNLFSFKFGKMKVLKWPLSRSLINGKFELVPWRLLLQTRYVNLFCFVFCKIKVLDWRLSRKFDFGLYAPTSLINGRIGMTLSRKYLVLYSVKCKYWNDFVAKMRFWSICLQLW